MTYIALMPLPAAMFDFCWRLHVTKNGSLFCGSAKLKYFAIGRDAK